MHEIVPLNEGQLEGVRKFDSFYLDPKTQVMKLIGESGTGKSTLVKYLLNHLDDLHSMAKLLDPSYEPLDLIVSATTHQACEALTISTDGVYEVRTIHSVLCLRLNKDLKTGKSELIPRLPQGHPDLPKDSLIVVDEVSFMDQKLLSHLYTLTENCKFLLVGDSGQLTPVGSTFMPAFAAKGIEHTLSKVERQAAGPLFDLCKEFRKTVFESTWPKIELDGEELIHLPRLEWEAEIYNAFMNPEVYGNCKVLAYTNAAVINMNNMLSSKINGSAAPKAGQRMLCNTAVTNRTEQIKTNEEVLIIDIQPGHRWGLPGYNLQLAGMKRMYFMPTSRDDLKMVIKTARNEDDFALLGEIDGMAIDLRPSFSCTVNKSQGSTFDTVFIDLDDIGRYVRSANQLARALYVSYSRARKRVIMTGDL